MARYFPSIVVIIIVIVAIALLGGLVWANTTFAQHRPIEKNFLVPWLGARTFLQYGQSPYEPSASQRAQIVYYGRLATKNQDPLALWLPFPAELFYFPFALVNDYALALGLWTTCMEVALVALAFFSLRLANWTPRGVLLAFIFLFSIFWVYGALSLVSGNPSGFVAVVFAGFLVALRRGQDELAGTLLLLSGFILSLTGIFLFFFLWWIFYQRRWRILAGFVMSLTFLVGLSFLFIPNWVLPFIRGVINHRLWSSNLTTFQVFSRWSPVVGQRLAWGLAALLLLLLFMEWGAALKNEFRHVLWTIFLTIAVTPLMGFSTVVSNYVIYSVPLFLLINLFSNHQGRLRRWMVAVFSLGWLLIIPWLLVLFLNGSHATTALPETLFLLLPLLLVVSLYWMRWRFVRKPAFDLSVEP